MITSTQLIREAALLTKSIEVKPGKTITYQDPPLEQVPDTTCWLCGGDTKGIGLPTKKRILDTFTDHSWARGQGSKSLCSGCSFCLSIREMRNYSILASPAGLRHPSRQDWREILFTPPEPPFVICLAVSGQKHLTFKAPVNYSREIFTVALEEQMIEVRPEQYSKCLKAVEALYVYFTKEEISAGRYSQNRIRQCGMDHFMKLEEQLTPWRRSRLFELALYVAQRQEVKEAMEVVHSEPQKTVAGNKRRNKKPVQIGFEWA